MKPPVSNFRITMEISGSWAAWFPTRVSFVLCFIVVYNENAAVENYKTSLNNTVFVRLY